MVRKIFTTRNNKSTREVGEGREGSELCGEQQAKRTQRHCKSFSLLEWYRKESARGSAVSFGPAPFTTKGFHVIPDESFGTQGEHFLYKV